MLVSAALGAWQILAISFQLPELKFQCVPDDVVLSDKILDPRLKWNETQQLLSEYQVSQDQCTIIINGRNETCTKWVFESDGSLVQDFNLVCENEGLVSITKAVFMGGMMAGTLFSGVLSDIFGRKKLMIATAIIFSIISCCVTACTTIYQFMALRFLVAMSGIALYTTCYVYSMEMIGGIWNTLIGIGFQIPWAVAYMILPGLAYALPYWAHLQIVISLPCLLFLGVLLIPNLVPESPKWLLANGYEKEAEEILDRAAEMNGMPPLANIQNLEKGRGTPVPDKWSYFDLFKSPHTIVCSLVMFFLWFANSLIYYGMLLNAGTLLPGDIYINNFVSGVLEVLAYIITTLVFLYGGRRFPMSITMLFGGAALLLALIGYRDPNESNEDDKSGDTVKLAFGQLGKFAITGGFAMVYLYAAELFPTVLRNSGMAFSSFWARVGSISAPFAGRELAKIDGRSPIYLFAFVSLIAGILTLVLPETKDTVLCDTIKESEEFIANKDNTFRKCLPKPRN